jgi:hypothetical protein
MTDVTIFYQGGSGGFALYYYLMLSGKYQYDINTAQTMVNIQFSDKLSSNPKKWKEREFWPDNVELKKQTRPKLFLLCNPLLAVDAHEQHKWISDNTHKILLYTDIHLQLRMCWEKQAYWFTKFSRQYFNAPDDNRLYFRQIIGSSKEFNGSRVDPMILEIIDYFTPNQTVRLEDFINTGALDNFSKPNQQQVDFLHHWRSLQPAKALQKFIL